MYSVVSPNADPYLELDTPVPFSSYCDALKYATDVAVAFRAEEHWIFTISGPDGSLQWSIKALLFHRWSHGAAF
jgi:hypothetical protein